MKSTLFCVCFASVALWAQIPPTTAAPPVAAITPDTVVATIDGKKLTARDVQKLVGALPPQNQQHFANDPKEFLRQRVLLEKLSAMGEQKKLDQQSPYKERIDYNRQLILSQAVVENQFESLPAPESEWKAFYEKNKSMFSEAKLRVVYIPFNVRPNAADQSGAKPLTEAEAKAQADAALAEIRKGTDFSAVVKKYSKDPVSAAKGGDFGSVKRSADLPPDLKNAIFSTKAGETSAPFRHTNGYYLFNVVSYNDATYDQVKGEVERLVRQGKFNTWLEGVRSGIEIKIENEAFFAKPKAK
ncbi:MAG: peptidylprolyl isomerase [Acidobacteriales bacterium]|nr:peptidylprolyl isomerase [Terriglobales bacterium]